MSFRPDLAAPLRLLGLGLALAVGVVAGDGPPAPPGVAPELAPPPARGVLDASALWPDRARELGLVRAELVRQTPFVLRDEDAASRTAALAERARRRAFEGAPPPMQHSVQFVQGSKDCLSCHRDGMELGPRVARPMSHVELPNCLQCHVEAVHDDFGDAVVPPATTFDGLATRVPPPVPHELLLREDCAACHGARPVERLPEDARLHRGRGSPGAPPIMPHHAVDEASRDCSVCHVTAVRPVEELGHPLADPAFTDCMDCHRADAHVPWGAAAGAADGDVLPPPPEAASLPREDCLACHGAFASTDGALAVPSREPPRLPHGTLLRTRCVSCHGEHGYAGLRVDHEHLRRAQCLQCHLPMDGIAAPAPSDLR